MGSKVVRHGDREYEGICILYICYTMVYIALKIKAHLHDLYLTQRASTKDFHQIHSFTKPHA